MTLAAIYAPNEVQIPFLEAVFSKLTTWGEGTWLLAGDFNYVADLMLDRTYRHGRHAILSGNTFTALHALFTKYQVLDCWRQLHPSEKDYTYFSRRHDVHTRLDYCLISSAAAQSLATATIGPNTLSDHSWVACTFSFQDAEPREFHWSLNKSLLDSPLVKEGVTTALKTYIKCNNTLDCNIPLVWDALKASMRGV